MPQLLSWRKTLGAKLGAIILTLLITSLFLALSCLYTVNWMRADTRAYVLFNKGSNNCYRVLYLMDHLANEQYGDAPQAREELPKIMVDVDRRFAGLLDGDPRMGIEAVLDPEIRAGTGERRARWETRIKPHLELLLAKGVTPEAKASQAQINELFRQWAAAIEKGRVRFESVLAERFRRIQWALIGFTVIVVAVLLYLLALGRDLARRSRALAETAERITAGAHGLRVEVAGSDELAAAGNAFNAMTETLRKTLATETKARSRMEKVIDNLREAVTRLASVTAEILASTSEQANGAQQQAAAVGQTVTTVDEVAQTAAQAAQRAKGVGEAVQRNLDIGQAGRRAIEESIAALHLLREKVEATAANILQLAEQAQAIGDIIATVNDIAEQTNILALNAAIEASRAGEQG